MKFLFRSIFIAFLFPMINGCAHLYMSDSELIESINRKVSDNRYIEAINMIDLLPKRYENKWAFVQKRKEVNKKLSEYENKIIAHTSSLENSGKWKKADLTYRTAIKNIPGKSPVVEAYNKYKVRQSHQIKKLQLETYNVHARYLIEAMKLQKNIENSFTANEIHGTTLDDYNYEAKQLSIKLHKIGLQSIENNDYIMAIRAIHMAKVLNPEDKDILQSLDKLNQRAEVIEQYVDTLKKQAASHYGAESYEVALKLWEGVLVYTPDDKEILDKVERVKRVLDSLQQIERTQL